MADSNEWVDVPLKEEDGWEDVPVETKPDEKMNRLQAGLTTAAQGATLGFLPRLMAGMGSEEMYSDVAYGAAEPPPLKEKIDVQRNIQSGVEGAVKKAREDYPVQSFITEAGAAAIPETLGTVATGGMLLPAMASGGAYSASGASDLTDVYDTATKFGAGAALGLAGGYVGNKVGKFGKEALKKFAKVKAATSVKMTPTQLMKLTDKGIDIDDLGSFMLENKIVKSGATQEEMMKALVAKGNEVGKRIGNIVKAAEEKGVGKVNLDDVQGELFKLVNQSKEEMLPSLREVGDVLEKEITDLKGEIDITKAQELKQKIGSIIDWKSNDPKKEIWRALDRKITESIDKIGGNVKDYKKLKRAYQITQEMMPASKYGAAKEKMLAEIPLKEMGAAGLGMAAHGGEGLVGKSAFGTATALGAKAIRGTGRPTLAASADAFANGIGWIPERLRKTFQDATTKGQKSVAVLDYILSQSDEEYRNSKNKQLEKQRQE